MSKDHHQAVHSIRRIRVFKWNVDIPINANIMFLFLNNSSPLKPTDDHLQAEEITPKLVPVKLQGFPYNNNSSSNMASIKELKAFALTVMANAYQSLPETIKLLGAEIAHYLENNFRLSFETLLGPKGPKTIIVVEYNQGEKISKEEGSVHMDYIIRTLKYELRIPREVSMKAVAVDEPLGLLQVPPLTIFQECEGGAVVDDACAICQQGFSGLSDPRKTSCSHRDCIGRWLWTRLSCPVCRLQLV